MITTVNRVTGEGAQVQEERWQCSALYHDSAHARQVVDLIASVAGSGSMEVIALAAPSQEVARHSVDFSPHDLEEAFRLGDLIAVMKDGRLLQIGTAEQLRRQPTDDYVRLLLAMKSEVTG